jgi:peptide/nickel transport system substrate-binding protein
MAAAMATLGATGVVALAGTAAPRVADASVVAAHAAKSGGTLVLAANSAPSSLNPALNGNGVPQAWFTELAYDPLIEFSPSGHYVPDLATSWKYVGKGNKVFDITLRKGVKFSDGTLLTAAGVKAYFEYYKKADGPFAGRLDQVSVIKVTGPLSLQLDLSVSDPYLPYYFSQDLVSGDVISVKGMQSASKLGSSTDGAGPYVLDSAATVTGNKYVFVPNKYYWNPSAIHWKKVVVEIISSNSATLDALRTGAVDYAIGTPTDAPTAKKDGLSVNAAPLNWASIFLFDHTGKTTPALKSAKVRQALNWAIDRPALAKQLWGQYGQPSDEVVPPGQVGYSKADAKMYGFNVAKAKKLLAEAGYPNGFTMPMLSFNLAPNETVLAQAIASSLSAIGVNMPITTPATLPEYLSDQASYKYAGTIFEYGSQPIYVEGQEILYPNGGALNPFHDNNKQFDALIAKIGSAPGTAAITADSNALETAVMKQAWYVPVGVVDMTYFSSKKLGNTAVTAAEPNSDPVWLTPKN